MKKRLSSTALIGTVCILGSLLLGQVCLGGGAGGISVENMRCEYLVKPLGIDTVRPRFGWILESEIRGQKQSAYRVIVASSESKLKAGVGDKWDSGKVESDRSVNIVYAGKGLSSGEKCYWGVRVWDKEGNGSAWSEIGSFEMGLLEESDWGGKWIRKKSSAKKQNFITGKFDKGVSLNGISESIVIEHYDRLKPAKAITISAWVKPGRGLLSKGEEWSVIYRKEEGGMPQLLALGRTGYTEGVWLGLVIDGEYTEYGAPIELDKLVDDKWHLVTATYDGKFKKVYVDGKEIGSKAVSGSISTAGSDAVYIGSYTGNRELFGGEIDDVRVYDTALIGMEVKRLAMGDDVSYGLVGHWPLDGDLANTVKGNGGKLIEAVKMTLAPLFRKEFKVGRKIKRARVYMSGLGWSELYINGKKVSDRILDPATTVYNEDQPFELDSRVLYVTHDVTDYLQKGQNAMGVMLGDGWYSGNKPPGRMPFGRYPILLLQMNIEYDNGKVINVVSDESWKAASGPITSNEICIGESYDARLEKTGWDSAGYDDSDWDKPSLAEVPSGKLVAQTMEPVKVMQTIKPVKKKKIGDGSYVFDFGQIISGWTKLRVKGPKGTKVTIRHASRVHRDGSLDHHGLYAASQTDSYILKGDGVDIWEPRFTLHSFRYAQVTGFPGEPTAESLEGRFAYNDIETSGNFECSNPLLNQIHEMVCQTFESSFQGIPQDAADRPERVGWMGDTGFVAEDYIYNYFDVVFWSKWLDDIQDSQNPDGSVPVICPLNWRYGPELLNDINGILWDPQREWTGWMSTYPLVAWYMYQYYGNERVLTEHYDALAELVGYLDSIAEDYIIGSGIGDHMEPDRASKSCNFYPTRTPQSLTSTAYYYYDTLLMARMAKVLGKDKDFKRYTDLAAKIKKAFNDKYLDKETNQYATASQCSNAIALHLELVPDDRKEAVLKNLVDDIMIANEGHFSTGIIGTNALEQILGQMSRADVMYEIANKTTFPSWGYMIANGATTLWEELGGGSSLNMKMFGSTEIFFYRDIGGIAPAAPGFKKIMIRPNIVGDLNYAKASLKTVNGLIAVDWKKADKRLSMKVTIPVNTTARVYVPTMGLGNVKVTESNVLVFKRTRFYPGTAGIVSGAINGDYVTFEIDSGDYSFTLTGQEKTTSEAQELMPIPDKLVVLTFDDRSRTWLTYVAPLLKEYGFGATFYVTEAGWIREHYGDEKLWLTWDDVRKLRDMGFEIGNHTGSHPVVTDLSMEGVIAELETIEQLCEANGIPRPTTFAYPGAVHDLKSVIALEQKDYLFARRGEFPEYPFVSYHSALGPAYDPKEDHPLLVPLTMCWGDEAKFEYLIEAVGKARDGKIAVFVFHGVPDPYPHCSTNQEDFAKCMKYLHDGGYKVIALRDLEKYVDPYNRPDDPYEPIRMRMERMKSAAAVQK